MKISFNANPQKIIEAITWAANRLPGSDRYTILKILFYADKYHLQKYGRPVTGDIYIKMTAGPVASLAYDIIKRNTSLPRELLLTADKAFKTASNSNHEYPPIEAVRCPDLDWFSGTDLECLEKAAGYCSDKTFTALKNTTHQEVAWLEASMNCEMDFSLFIDEDVPNREELLAYIAETAPCQMI